MKTIPSLAVICLAFSLATTFTQAADSTKPDDKSDAPKAADSAKPDAATPAKPIVLPDPVAVVEGAPISKSELEQAFNTALTQAGKKAGDIPDDQKMQGYQEILNEMIIEKLVTSRSAKEEVTDAEVDQGLAKFKAQFPSEDQLNEELKQAGQTIDKIKENIRVSLKQEKWIESQITGKDTVTEADAQDFYNKHPELFKMPEQVRASHILIAVPEGAKPEEVAAKEKQAKEIAAKVKKGDDFAKTAKEVSEDPGSKANGGDLDFFSRDRMVPEFADAAFKMKKGDISDPVKTQFGFHIIKVTDKKEARTVPFAEVKDKVLAYLKDSKHKAAVEELITGMRQKADVKVNLPEPEKATADKPSADKPDADKATPAK